MKPKFESYWMGRSEREKKLLFLAALFLSSSLLYAFVWMPGEKAGAKLSRELPVLRAKLQAMRGEAIEIKKLRNRAPERSRLDVKQAIEASAEGLGLSRIEADADGRIHAEFSPVSFDRWVAWLDRVGTESHIVLESAHVRKIEGGGRVSVTAVFAASGGT